MKRGGGIWDARLRRVQANSRRRRRRVMATANVGQGFCWIAFMATAKGVGVLPGVLPGYFCARSERRRLHTDIRDEEHLTAT